MIFEKDDRLDEIKQIEDLLYGYNYQVSLNIYGPADSSLPLPKAIQTLISRDCEVDQIELMSPSQARDNMKDLLLYEGDSGAGPIDLDVKRDQVLALLESILSHINFDKQDKLSAFNFRRGHPAYPVFWDFAYDVQIGQHRWILVGSSSD